jgi:hypothetical protein
VWRFACREGRLDHVEDACAAAIAQGQRDRRRDLVATVAAETHRALERVFADRTMLADYLVALRPAPSPSAAAVQVAARLRRRIRSLTGQISALLA